MNELEYAQQASTRGTTPRAHSRRTHAAYVDDPPPTPPRSAAGADPQAVPPVRTIVLNRPPEPVRPPAQREAVRRALEADGPERLRLEDGVPLGCAWSGHRFFGSSARVQP